MDYESYKKAYFTDPIPQPRFGFIGLYGFALYIKDYQAALKYYTDVLGPPAYVEDKSTHGWQIGNAWLTLFPSNDNDPQNMEIHILMESAPEAERLHKAFIDAGGKGDPPSDQLMYEPFRFCFLKDPFNTSILILSRTSK